MSDEEIEELLTEIRNEQHISPYEEDSVLSNYIKEAEKDINEVVSVEIDYSDDLKARVLLKNYVLYRRFERMAEFTQLYGGDYAYLQAKYNNDSNV